MIMILNSPQSSWTRLLVELICAQDNKLLEVLTEEQLTDLCSPLPCKQTTSLISNLNRWTTLWARKTLSSLIPNKPTDRRTDLTEGRTFNTETKTELDTDKRKNPWITEPTMDNLLRVLQMLSMATPADKNDAKTHLKKPIPFHGDRIVKKFLQECDLYILGNSKDFPTNDSKVIFILSYMDDREAEKWKQYFINNKVITAGSYVWPKLAEFYAKVKEAFAFEDEKEDSVRKLETLRQGNRNAEEMTNKFRLLVTKAGLNEDNQMLICTYWHALNPQLANKIMYSTEKPSMLKDMGKDTTLKKGWYSIVAQYDQIHHEAQEAMKEQQLTGSLQYAQKNTNNNWQPQYNYAP